MAPIVLFLAFAAVSCNAQTATIERLVNNLRQTPTNEQVAVLNEYAVLENLQGGFVVGKSLTAPISYEINCQISKNGLSGQSTQETGELCDKLENGTLEDLAKILFNANGLEECKGQEGNFTLKEDTPATFKVPKAASIASRSMVKCIIILTSTESNTRSSYTIEAMTA